MSMCEDQAEDFEINHLEHINKVNSEESTWTAGANQRFLSDDFLKASDVKATLGAIIDSEWTVKG